MPVTKQNRGTKAAYTYDRNGNRATMTAGSVVTTYTYDPNNRLTYSTTSGVRTEYVYDRNGNQLREETPTAPTTKYLHEFDADGTGKLTINRYDAFNRLIASNTDSGNAYFTYQPDGLRHSKQNDNALTLHIWNGQNMAAELNGENTVTALYIRGINLIYADRAEAPAPAYYLFNGHGDVVQLVENGTVTKTYTYDAFGVEQNKDATDANPFRYCAEYYDNETNTIYLRARYYAPTQGRFLSQDAWEHGKANDPLSLNLYTYCHNNPIYYLDSSGNVVITAAIIFFGSIIISAGISWAADLGSQLIWGEEDEPIDTDSLWASMGSGGLAGAMGGLAGPASSIVMAGVQGALISGARYGSYHLFNGSDPTVAGYAFNMGVGFTLGAVMHYIIYGAPVPKGAGSNVPKYPGNDPSVPPGKGWEWRGSGDPSSGKGSWYNPETGGSLHPDLNHGDPIGPHYDYIPYKGGPEYRLMPDGSLLPK